MPSTEHNCLTELEQHIIHVVAGVIYHQKDINRILISKRRQDAHQGGLWEFPGGKVDSCETSYQALQRELMEELSIEVTQAEPLMQLRHDYSDKQILLDIWTVLSFNGKGKGMEGQECRWVTLQEILGASSNYQFPQANKPILERLRTQISNEC